MSNIIITKEMMDVVSDIFNFYIQKGFVVKGLNLNTRKHTMRLRNPNIINDYLIDSHHYDTITSYFVKYDTFNIVDGLWLPWDVRSNMNKTTSIIELINRINSVITQDKFDLVEYGIHYQSEIGNFSQNTNILNNVLTNHLEQWTKFYPLITRVLTSDESPSSIWEDYEKSSLNVGILNNWSEEVLSILDEDLFNIS